MSSWNVTLPEKHAFSCCFLTAACFSRRSVSLRTKQRLPHGRLCFHVVQCLSLYLYRLSCSEWFPWWQLCTVETVQGWIHIISPLTTWKYTHAHRGQASLHAVQKAYAHNHLYWNICRLPVNNLQSLSHAMLAITHTHSAFPFTRLIACGHKHRWLFTTTHMAVRLEVQWLICLRFDHCSGTRGSSWLWLVKLL